MATNKTEQFGLNQWDKIDPVRVEDFNEDNRKTEEALQGLDNKIIEFTTIVTGTYQGDSTATRVIPLPFTPRLLFVSKESGEYGDYSVAAHKLYGGIAAPGFPCSYKDVEYLTIVENGFRVRYKLGADYTPYYYTNSSNFTYRYIALR